MDRPCPALQESVTEKGTIDDLWDEWRDTWLTSLQNQVWEIHHRRQIHDEFLDLLRAQGHPDTTFADVFHLMYVESMMMAIRRQIDKDERSLSIRRLMGQLETHRKQVTRLSFTNRWLGDRDPNDDVQWKREDARYQLDRANEVFDRFTDRPGADHLGGRWLAEDRKALDEITATIKRHADQVVAHVDRTPENAAVTYSEFESAIDYLGELLAKYLLLLEQASLMSPKPTIQGDWLGPFREALVGSG